MTTPSPDSLWVAHHEAGHLVAATLRGIEWNHATIERVGGYDGHVLCRPTGAFLDPQNQAFLFWAGAYAESRFTNRPLDEVTRSPNCRDDLAVFGPHRTRARDREWAAEIDLSWQLVAECAARLLVAGTITPHQPDPLQDSARVERFLERAALTTGDSVATHDRSGAGVPTIGLVRPPRPGASTPERTP